MEIGKRGAVFTLIALVMVSILFMVSQTTYMNQMQRQSFVVQHRINSVDYFVEDLERDIKRGMYIATYRGLIGLQQEMTSEGQYINDTSDALNQIIVNGTYNGSYLSVMNNSELNTWFDRIRREATKLSIDVNYTIERVSVYHLTPWKIQIQMNLSLNVSDQQGVSRWVRDNPLEANLSITGFEDPLYNVNTKGKVVSIIERTNVTDFVSGNDTTGLLNHIDNHYYRTSNSSPSYLMRISGNLNSSPYGIESIVDLRELDNVGITLKDKSCIDYVYFSTNSPPSWKINNTYNWLRLDNESEHLQEYEVEGLLI